MTLDLDDLRRKAEGDHKRNVESKLRGSAVYSHSCLDPQDMIALLDRLAAAERVVEEMRPEVKRIAEIGDPGRDRTFDQCSSDLYTLYCSGRMIWTSLSAYDRAKEG